jgi:hypothetical protein
MVERGISELVTNNLHLNDINVFPIADGDTGTNMKLTLLGGFKAIEGINDTSIGEMARKLYRGLLMSSKGNSGSILAQFFKGFKISFKDKEIASVIDLKFALKYGMEAAYKAVFTPVEGTMLTIMKDAYYKIDDVNYDTLDSLLYDYLKEAKSSLKRTPELLDVLRQFDVVDSGALGFVYIIDGMYQCVKNSKKELE